MLIFSKYSKEILEKNRKIQVLDKSEIKRINKLNSIDENTQMNKNEKYFCELFRQAINIKYILKILC